MAPTVIHKHSGTTIVCSHISIMFQFASFAQIPIEISKSTSPIRFARAVTIPAARDFMF